MIAALVLAALALLALATRCRYWRWRAVKAEAETSTWKELARIEIATSKFARRDGRR